MVKILGISGKKQSGKNTVANYINGYILKEKGLIQDFIIDNNGQLNILTTDNEGVSGWGIFDVTRKDQAFCEYAHINLWPYVKVYHFADLLKEISMSLFGLSYEQVYGTDAQKNTKIGIMWEDMPENKENNKGEMTSREFLQHFGTNVIRKIKNEAWVDSTIKRISEEKTQLAIIPDVRFPNEVEAIHRVGGSVMRLTRNIANSNHKCECALDESNFDWNKFDKVIDNNGLSIKQLSDLLSTLTYIWKA
jgi:hypothetical protein